MASKLTTPGVYIEEKNAFPTSAVAVETAVPVFIGYTEKACFKGEALENRPVRITSFAEYSERFGRGFVSRFRIAKVDEGVGTGETAKGIDGKIADSDSYVVAGGSRWHFQKMQNSTAYMYDSIRMFFANGGGPCYIYSVGTYGGVDEIEIRLADFANADIFNALEREYEPTLVVMPDVIGLGADAYKVYQMVLAHCDKVQSRFAIFDLAKTTQSGSDDTDLVVAEFRELIGDKALKYGAAYYPWLKTAIVAPPEVGLDNMVVMPDIAAFLPEEDAQKAIANFNKQYNPGPYYHLFVDSNVELNQRAEVYRQASEAYNSKPDPDTSAALASALKSFNEYALKLPPISPELIEDTTAKAKALLATALSKYKAAANDESKARLEPALQNLKDRVAALEAPGPDQVKHSFQQALKAVSPTYVATLEKIRAELNILPPSGAMAGIYTMVDNTRGVWKAPANVSVNMVNSPSLNIAHDMQEKLNVDVTGGKSVNVIRAFPGIGTLVWGGRTLDGNSLDWRYINVRRTLIMIEQSLKLAVRAFVFEPNDANTWLTVKSMISNFLTNLWKQGALAGGAPEQAFDVQIGLGSTMTATDILEGTMLVSVKVAIVRPAEFIVITFSQQLQQS